MDALSDVLRAVKLGGAVFLNAEFSSPWCVTSHVDAGLCAAYLPGSHRVISYHLVTEGVFHARLADEQGGGLQLCAGELLVVPQGETHIMGSSLQLPPVLGDSLLADQMQTGAGGVMRLAYGGGGARTRIVCGFLACDDAMINPLLASLPRMFKVDVRNGSGSAWLESSLRFAAEEGAESRPGSATVLARLSELLFVEAVRRCIETAPEGEKNWLAGLRDRFVGRALSLLHARPAHDWTVDQLASEVGLSRSALAQRFSEFLGQPPMQYLARWRLQIAARQLLDGAKSLAAVAEDVGYDSEAAFNRAFKREFGMPPASWRRSEIAGREPRKP